MYLKTSLSRYSYRTAGRYPFLNSHVTIYYLPGTTGWGPVFAGVASKLWDAHIQTGGSTFGVRTNRFGFTIVSTNVPMVVVEACTNLANPVWSPVSTWYPISGSSYFFDPYWTNHATRLYRLRLP
jgi:hypothetical protein